MVVTAALQISKSPSIRDWGKRIFDSIPESKIDIFRSATCKVPTLAHQMLIATITPTTLWFPKDNHKKNFKKKRKKDAQMANLIAIGLIDLNRHLNLERLFTAACPSQHRAQNLSSSKCLGLRIGFAN